jgi:hypothetical protein
VNAVVVVCEACGEAPAHTKHNGFDMCRLCMLDAVEPRWDDEQQLEADSNETLNLRR